MFRTLSIAALCMLGIAVKAQTVTLDCYFNHETRTTKSGAVQRFHYLWNETDASGYSIWGNVFKQQGFKLDTLGTAPTVANLKGTSVYIIVDPDSKKESANPHYIMPDDITAISSWVKKGGVLVMLANDSANVELPHFNQLAAVFGVHFNNDLQNHVINDAHFDDGAINTTGNPVFPNTKKVFMKDVCSISTSGAAKPLLKNNNGATVIAQTKYGKGTVISIADPWLYNEYVNGRLPAGFENDKAAQDITAWIKKQL